MQPLIPLIPQRLTVLLAKSSLCLSMILILVGAMAQLPALAQYHEPPLLMLTSTLSCASLGTILTEIEKCLGSQILVGYLDLVKVRLSTSTLGELPWKLWQPWACCMQPHTQEASEWLSSLTHQTTRKLDHKITNIQTDVFGLS